MIRQITSDDFFDALEIHRAIIQGHIDSSIQLINTGGEYWGWGSKNDYVWEDKDVLISLFDTKKRNCSISPIPYDYWDISFEPNEIRVTETLNLWENYFRRGTVFLSSTILETHPRTIECKVAIGLGAWDSMRKHKFLDVARKKVPLLGSDKVQTYALKNG